MLAACIIVIAAAVAPAAPLAARSALAAQSPEAEKKTPAKETPQAPPPPALDFELLGPPPPPTLIVDEAALHRRRALLNLHQAVGLGMLGIALANTVVGQLNYSDRFASGPSTGRYQLAHKITAYGTLGAFAATGVLAVLAPNPIPKTGGFDQITLHKISMITATAGMATEAGLGLWTARREGYLNQPNIATAHLVLGYVTMAAIAVGFGAIVF